MQTHSLKHSLYLIFIFFFGWTAETCFAQNSASETPVQSSMALIQSCTKAKKIRAKYKSQIQAPYEIEGCASRAILCGEPGHEAVIQVSVLGKQRYRFYFDNEGFEGRVFVRLSTLNKKVLFTNESEPELNMFAFTATRTEKYFVEFVYPQSKNPDAVGCVSVVVATREF